MSRKWMMALWGLSLTVLLIGNSVEASIAPEDRAQLQQSHGAFFYLCKKSVNIDTQAKKEQARQLIITGQDFQMAKALLNKVIELDSKDSEAYLLRALLYTDAKKYDNADNDYMGALRLEPENPTFYYLRAMNSLYRGRSRGQNNGFYLDTYYYIEAKKYFNKALEIEPNYIDAIVGMGDCAYDKKEYNEAIDWYNKVLVMLPNHDVVLAKKTDAEVALKKIQEKQQQRELDRRING